MPGALDRLRRLAGVAGERNAEPARASADRDVRSCTDREYVTVRGTLVSVTPSPAGVPPQLVAELDDGSGTVRIVWLGRRAVGGIAPGTLIEVSGRISCTGRGRLIHNPRYRLLRVPGTGPMASSAAP